MAQTRVANVLLALKLKGGAADGAATAAQDIARSTAREALAPLMDCATARLSSVLKTTFDIALDSLSSRSGEPWPALSAARVRKLQIWVCLSPSMQHVRWSQRPAASVT